MTFLTGVVAVSVNTAIGQAYPERLRPRALALMSARWIVPSLAGPPPAGLASAWCSWRAVFYGLAALTVLPTLALMVVLRGPVGASVFCFLLAPALVPSSRWTTVRRVPRRCSRDG
ncbi:hypothetical protein [Streptomyces prunicolor]|uniref:hypothetical protein n=1 Tax=Streptomyces prunicolor TaxID=67348 RepID=UPI003867FF3D